MNQSSPPAGWYADPENPQGQRYWDGARWTEDRAPGPAAQTPAVPAQAVAAPERVGAQLATTTDPYQPGFDVTTLPEDQREAYKRHTLFEFPTWGAVVLSLLSFGFFATIWHGAKHSQLPAVKQDDFTAGRAIGFSFIPFFNLYWGFVFWLRLGERINFQYRLRGAPDPISRQLVIWTGVFVIATSILVITFPVAMVLGGMVVARIQTAANELARGQVGV